MGIDLPDDYVPRQLRPVDLHRHPTQVAYAIGFDHGDKTYAMTHGPSPDLYEMLEVVPEHGQAVILRFNLDRSYDILYRWRDGAWRKRR